MVVLDSPHLRRISAAGRAVRTTAPRKLLNADQNRGIQIATQPPARTWWKPDADLFRKRVVDPIAPLGLIHLRYIEMFQAILQAGTLTDAACLLNISQPAATKLLKQAERRLGFPLFVRVKGQWQLTSESELRSRSRPDLR